MTGSFSKSSQAIGLILHLGFPGGSVGKESTCNAGDLGSILVWEDPLEKGKATHSSILTWRIPWTVAQGVAKSRTCLSDFHFHLRYIAGCVYCR